MSKRVKVALIVAVVAVAGYLVYRHFRNSDNGSASPTGSLGSNLNSVAPELVGGSTGPSVGPAVTMPLQITLNETVARPDEGGEPKMQDGGQRNDHHLHRQRNSAKPGDSGLSVMGAGTPAGTISDEGSDDE